VGARVPHLRLGSAPGPVDLADLAADRLVLFVYPHATGLPDAPVTGWEMIPGAGGCTAQSCAFRDRHDRFVAFDATVVGLSVQTPEEQAAFAARVALPFRLLSDPELRVAAALGLPTFRAGERAFYERITVVAEEGRIVSVFHPVVSPERNPEDVLAWFGACERTFV
jgi:peroxiredoxin